MKNRGPVITSFVLFIILCASAAYWALQLFQPPLRPVAAPPLAAAPEIRPQAAAALFGGASAATASNYQLRGVIFAGNPSDSVAILSADGKPAQAIRAGTEIVPGVTVKEVHRGYVLLAENGTSKRVDLPESAAEQGGINSSPVATRPLPPPPTQIPQAPPAQAPQAPPAQMPGIPPAPAQQPDAAPPDQTPVPDAAAARSRAFEQSGGQAAAEAQQGAQAQFAPAAPSSVVVNPGGGVSTEVGPAQGN